jgi:hypothetical protein
MFARTLVVVLAACHLGRPPAAVDGVNIVAVRSSVAEAGLSKVLQSDLNAALVSRGIATNGPEVELRIWDASTSVVAVEEGRRVLRARLEVEILVYGARPKETRLVLEQSFAAPAGGGLAGPSERTRVFEALAHRAAEDAVDWILHAPKSE